MKTIAELRKGRGIYIILACIGALFIPLLLFILWHLKNNKIPCCLDSARFVLVPLLAYIKTVRDGFWTGLQEAIWSILGGHRQGSMIHQILAIPFSIFFHGRILETTAWFNFGFYFLLLIHLYFYALKRCGLLGAMIATATVGTIPFVIWITHTFQSELPILTLIVCASFWFSNLKSNLSLLNAVMFSAFVGLAICTRPAEAVLLLGPFVFIALRMVYAEWKPHRRETLFMVLAVLTLLVGVFVRTQADPVLQASKMVYYAALGLVPLILWIMGRKSVWNNSKILPVFLICYTPVSEWILQVAPSMLSWIFIGFWEESMPLTLEAKIHFFNHMFSSLAGLPALYLLILWLVTAAYTKQWNKMWHETRPALFFIGPIIASIPSRNPELRYYYSVFAIFYFFSLVGILLNDLSIKVFRYFLAGVVGITFTVLALNTVFRVEGSPVEYARKFAGSVFSTVNIPPYEFSNPEQDFIFQLKRFLPPEQLNIRVNYIYWPRTDQIQWSGISRGNPIDFSHITQFTKAEGLNWNFNAWFFDYKKDQSIEPLLSDIREADVLVLGPLEPLTFVGHDGNEVHNTMRDIIEKFSFYDLKNVPYSTGFVRIGVFKVNIKGLDYHFSILINRWKQPNLQIVHAPTDLTIDEVLSHSTEKSFLLQGDSPEQLLEPSEIPFIPRRMDGWDRDANVLVPDKSEGLSFWFSPEDARLGTNQSVLSLVSRNNDSKVLYSQGDKKEPRLLQLKNNVKYLHFDFDTRPLISRAWRGDSIFSANEMTWFLVLRIPENSEKLNTVFAWGDCKTNQLTFQAPLGRFLLAEFADPESSAVGSNVPIQREQAVVVSFVRNKNVASLEVNGVQVGAQTKLKPRLLTEMQSPFVLGRSMCSDGKFLGDVGDIIFYKKALEGTQRAGIVRYLLKKFNISTRR